jgi:hypothetical protein
MVWGGKFEAIVESKKYDTLTVNELFSKLNSAEVVLTDKRCIHLRFASVRTYTFFTTRFPRFLSIRGARGL